jgi:hypothetical protein
VAPGNREENPRAGDSRGCVHHHDLNARTEQTRDLPHTKCGGCPRKTEGFIACRDDSVGREFKCAADLVDVRGERREHIETRYSCFSSLIVGGVLTFVR